MKNKRINLLLLAAGVFLAPRNCFAQLADTGLNGSKIEKHCNYSDDFMFKMATDGKITILDKPKRPLAKQLIPDIDVTSLKDWQLKSNDSAANHVIVSLDKAVEYLKKDNENNVRFYKSVWKADPNYVKKLASDLAEIKGKLEKKRPYTKFVDQTSPYYKLDSLIGNTIANPQQQAYYFPESPNDSYYRITYSTKDPYRRFLVNYYNLLMADGKNEMIPRLGSVAKMDSMAINAKIAAGELDSVIASLKQPTDLTSWRLRKIYTRYQKNDKGDALSYIRTPWFWQWLWYNKGGLSTTPLGFTSDDLVRKKPTVDKQSAEYKKAESTHNAKVAAYKSYMETLTRKFEKDTSEKDVLRFKKMVLDYYGKEDDVIKDNPADNGKVDSNKMKRDYMLGYTRKINEVEIPYDDGNYMTQYLYFTTDDTFQKYSAIRPITNDDHIKVTIFNVPKGNSEVLAVASAVPLKEQASAAVAINDAFGVFADVKNVLSFTYTDYFPVNSQPTQVPQRISNQTVNKMMTESATVIGENTHYFEVFNTLTDSFPALQSHPWDTVEKILRADHYTFLKRIAADFKDFEGIDLLTNASPDKAFVGKLKVLYPNPTINDVNAIITLYNKNLLNTVVKDAVGVALAKQQGCLRWLSEFFAQASGPVAKLTSIDPKAPDYSTVIHTTVPADSATRFSYKVLNITPGTDEAGNAIKDTAILGMFKFRTGKRFRLQASVGITYTCSNANVNTVSVDNGKVSVTTKNEQYGIAAMLHFYPYKGVLLQDNSFLGHRQEMWTRVNIMAGIDFRKVPDNVYLGIGYDMGPGVRIGTGVRLYKYVKYNVVNDQLADEHMIYKVAGPVIYLGVDPVALINAVNIFKK